MDKPTLLGWDGLRGRVEWRVRRWVGVVFRTLASPRLQVTLPPHCRGDLR